jgi:hypothetical protein
MGHLDTEGNNEDCIEIISKYSMKRINDRLPKKAICCVLFMNIS